MAEMVDDIEWVTPGNSAVGGTVRGKQALARIVREGFWGEVRGVG
jgi:hypothetical protein